MGCKCNMFCWGLIVGLWFGENVGFVLYIVKRVWKVCICGKEEL